jgi:hypothetical protein
MLGRCAEKATPYPPMLEAAPRLCLRRSLGTKATVRQATDFNSPHSTAASTLGSRRLALADRRPFIPGSSAPKARFTVVIVRKSAVRHE